MASDTLAGSARTDAEISGLDALEIAGREKGPSRVRRLWSATWPKFAALALAVAIWQAVVWSGWKEPWALPGPAVVFGDLGDYLLSSALCLVVAGWCLLARLFRLGIIADLLSQPLLVGYLAGGAVLTWLAILASRRIVAQVEERAARGLPVPSSA